MATYKPGQEPEEIKKRIETLFTKLDEAYPDKCIISLNRDYKTWEETVTELYRLLGYTDGKQFLEAYGYTYVKDPNGERRLKTADPVSLNGMLFVISGTFEHYSRTEIIQMIINCDGRVKNNISKATNYVICNTLDENSSLIKSAKKYGTEIISVEEFEEMIGKSKEREIQKIYFVRPLISEELLYCYGEQGIRSGDHVEVKMGRKNIPVYANVERIVKVNIYDLPVDVDAIKTIFRTVDTKEYNGGVVRSMLYTNAMFEEEKLFKNWSSVPFSKENVNNIQIPGNVTWAHCRGLSSDVLEALEFLIEKDRVIYDYSALIMRDNYISELFVFTDDVPVILERFPNLKICMFAENRDSGDVNLCYSKSGYPFITDCMFIGKYDIDNTERWTLRHSPADDFTDSEIRYIFKFADDWTTMNYIFEDKNGTTRQLSES